MKLPQFLDIEFADTGEMCFPTAMAWSLEDGSMKAVVIAPDDSWLPDDPESLDADLRYLEEQGVPLIELVRDLNEDLSDQTVFVDGIDPDESLVDLIFETLDMPVPFELATIDNLVKRLPADEIEDWRREVLFTHGLDPQLPENGVYALLMLARDEGIIPDDNQPDDL